MKEEKFNNALKELTSTLIDDFRGFLVEGEQRIEVPENLYHLQVAFQEMSKIPGWEYESGTGQNPMIEYMKEKEAIYITKILIPGEDGQNQKAKYQRTVGYLTDAFSEEIVHKGVKQKEYEVLKQIALGMGYDVDEYTLKERTEDSVKTPVSIVTYKGELHIRKSRSVKIAPHRTLSEGDKPVYGSNGQILGFISKGKFAQANEYKRYANIHSKHPMDSNDDDER